MGGQGSAYSEATSNGLAPAGNGFRAERVSDIQRARILAAMGEVSCERGAANVTVAHVVARSGVSRRTFYEQFKDREDCLLAALDDAVACLTRYVLPARAVGADWRERIRASLVALLQFLDEEPFMGCLIVVGTLGGDARVLERREELTRYAVAAVEEGRGTAGKRKGHNRADASEGPPPLTGEGLVGGVLSVLRSRLMDPDRAPMLELTSSLMSMIVLPYLGAAASRQELQRPVPRSSGKNQAPTVNPLRDLEMRLTYRTVCVLASVANRPGSSNREIGHAAGIHDQGQISKLLTRLTKLGLIENAGGGQARGAPNEWTLTRKGIEVEQAVRSPVSV